MPHRVHLRREHPRQPLRRQRPRPPRHPSTPAVCTTPVRRCSPAPARQGLHLGTVGHIAGHHRHRRTLLGEFGDQFLHSLGLRDPDGWPAPDAAHRAGRPDAGPPEHPTTRYTRDQNRPLRPEHRGSRRDSTGQRGQAGARRASLRAPPTCGSPQASTGSQHRLRTVIGSRDRCPAGRSGRGSPPARHAPDPTPPLPPDPSPHPPPAGTAPRVTTTSRDSSSPAPASHACTTAQHPRGQRQNRVLPLAADSVQHRHRRHRARYTPHQGFAPHRRWPPPPTTATASTPWAGGSSLHSTWNSELVRAVSAAVSRWSTDTSRNTSESAVRTRPPVSSAASTDSASGPHGATPHPQRRSTRGVQHQPVPVQRLPHRLPVRSPVDVPPAAAGVQHGRVQGRVQQRGVDAEPAGVLALLLGQGDLGEDLLAAAPHRPHPLERRTVAASPLRPGPCRGPRPRPAARPTAARP